MNCLRHQTQNQKKILKKKLKHFYFKERGARLVFSHYTALSSTISITFLYIYFNLCLLALVLLGFIRVLCSK